MRILIAEDETELNHIITKRLESEHYTMDSCYEGETALEYILMTEYDAVILDIMMPKMDGIEVLKAVRAKKISVPILLLTARNGIEDRVTGLDCGADDYLVKPFSFDELLARIRVMLRRTSVYANNQYELADLVVDCDTHKVSRGGTEITLSGKEFSILEYLIRNQGLVLSREKIEEHIWNYDYMGGSNVVDVYIRYLRRKIDENFEIKLIHTVRGAGYVLRRDG